MEKIFQKIQPKHYGLIAAALSALGMYIILSVCQYANGGKYIVLYCDYFEQYVPYIKMFFRNILEGESIWFSWSSSLGMNTSLLNLYYVMSPFNILYLIFWNVDENIITVIIILLKIALSAYTFQMFARKVLKAEGFESIFFSVSYALSMYMVLYGHMYNSWLEGMYMLPLICVLIYELSDLKSYLKLIIAYAYIFVTQFYFAYMVGIFTFVFWLVLLFVEKKQSVKEIIIKCVKYVGSVLLAAGIVAVALVPAAVFLMNDYAGSGVIDEHFPTQIYHLYYAMFWGNKILMMNHYPAIYCGWPVLILLPLYFINKNINKKEKVVSAIFLVLLVATMIIEPMYMFMHAFDRPNALNFRHAFLLVFVFCGISCRQAKKISDIQWKKALIIVAVNVVVYAGLEHIVSQDNENIGLRILANLLFGLLWIGILFLHNNQRIRKYELVIATIIVIMIEVCVNGWYGITYPNVIPRHNYECWKQGMVDIMAEIEDDEFYRAYYDLDLAINSDAWFGYNGVAEFSSVHNASVNHVLGNLGLLEDTLKIFSYGITPPVESVLGVKYRLEGPIPAYAYDSNNTYVIDENPYCLGIAYMVDSSITNFKFDGYSDFDNINKLIQTLSGKEVYCFKPFDGTIEGEIYQASIEQRDVGIVISYDATQYETGTIIYCIPEADVKKPVYAEVISDFVSVADKGSPYLLGGMENINFQYGLMSTPYIKPLLLDDGKWKIVIHMNENTASQWLYRDIVFQEYHEEALKEAYEEISKEQLQINEYGNGYIRGSIDVSGEKDVLFTTIPYDSAWEVKVDGRTVDTFSVLDDAFLALELEPGIHEIEFQYYVPGLKAGILVSAFCVVCVCGLFIYERIIGRKKDKIEVKEN